MIASWFGFAFRPGSSPGRDKIIMTRRGGCTSFMLAVEQQAGLCRVLGNTYIEETLVCHEVYHDGRRGLGSSSNSLGRCYLQLFPVLSLLRVRVSRKYVQLEVGTTNQESQKAVRPWTIVATVPGGCRACTLARRRPTMSAGGTPVPAT
jgi:hypothetical protein